MSSGRSTNATSDDTFETGQTAPEGQAAARTGDGTQDSPKSPSDPLAGLMDARFDDKGRLVSGGAGEAGVAPADLHRAVEALARRVESPPPPTETAPPPRPSSADTKSGILEMLDKLETRLDIMGRASPPRSQAPMAAMPDYRKNFAALEARIDALAHLAGQAGAGAGATDIARLGAQMEGLAKADSLVFERMEVIQRQLAELGAGLKGADAPAAAQFAALQERLDTIASSLAGGGDVPPAALAAIDAQFERLTERLGALGAAPAAPEELWTTLEDIRAALEVMPSRENLSVVDSRIQSLVAKIDSMEVDGASGEVLQKVDNRLHELAATIAQLRDRPDADAAETHRRLGELIERIDHLDENGATVDLQPIEARLADILARLDGLREESVTALTERMQTLSAELGANPDAAGAGNVEIARQLRALTSRLETAQGLTRADLVPIANRIGALESAMRATATNGAPGLPAGGLDEIRERLDAINARLDAGRDGAGSALGLEDKLERLAHALTALDDLTSLDDVTDLRGDIANLRRELRSMPAEGPAPANSAIVPILQDIAERLNRMPDAAPVTFRDLEDQIGRIVRLIESPETDHGALAQIDARLKDIQAQLSAGPGMAVAGDSGDNSDLVGLVSGIARSLSADISVLKESAAATEENTRRAMDSVHETLEAVVKRMAFLEGETERRRPDTSAGTPADAPSEQKGAPESSDSSDKAIADPLDDIAAAVAAAAAGSVAGAADARSSDDEPAARSGVARTQTADTIVLGDLSMDAIPEVSLGDLSPSSSPASAAGDAGRISLDVDAAADTLANEAEKAAAETAGPSLIGRLTPSQLLRRATGGRTESFSPEAPERKEIPDSGAVSTSVAEPLTSTLDGPSTTAESELSGSSDQEADDATADAGDDDADHLPGSNDFLMAARRAAQAAAAEAIEAERVNGIANDGSFLSNLVTALNARRYLVLGCALALVIALLLFQLYVNGQIPRGLFGGGTQISHDMPVAGEADMVADAGSGEAAANAPDSQGIIIAGADQAGGTMPDMETAGEEGASVVAIDATMAPGDSEAAQPGGIAELVNESAAVADGLTPADVVMPGIADAGTTEGGQAITVSRTAEGRVLATLPQSADTPTETPAGAPAKPDETIAFGTPQAPMHLQPSSRSAQVDSASLAQPTRIVALPDPQEPDAGTAAAAAAPARYPVPPAAIGPERLRRAAADGDPVAMFEVAVRFAEGRGVSPDSAASADWYRRAAEAGLAPAQYRLGSIYEKGVGVDKNLGTAETWYRRAAIAGNAKAMHNLAVLYAEGAGGNPDLAAAAGWFERAAEMGVRDSQFNIAILNARGLGVPEDMSQAYKWFAIAAKSGDQQAAERRDTVARVLSAADLNRLNAEVEAFRPRSPAPAANIVVRPIDKWETAGTAESNLNSPNTVLRTQQLLAAAGYRLGRPDGIFGPRTRQAIVEFQRAAGLPVSGQIDSLLIAALEARGI